MKLSSYISIFEYDVAGNLSLCRFYSKHIVLREFPSEIAMHISHLYLEIKAKEVGIHGDRYTS